MIECLSVSVGNSKRIFTRSRLLAPAHCKKGPAPESRFYKFLLLAPASPAALCLII